MPTQRREAQLLGRCGEGLGWSGELQNSLDEAIDGTGNGVITHQRDGIEEARHLIEVMGGNDHGAAVFLTQHLIKELAALCVKAEIGFVEKHDFAARSNGEDEAHRRLLPAGKGRISLGRNIKANQQLIKPLIIPMRPPCLSYDAQLSDAPGIR